MFDQMAFADDPDVVSEGGPDDFGQFEACIQPLQSSAAVDGGNQLLWDSALGDENHSES